jgi:hypothetical protein
MPTIELAATLIAKRSTFFITAIISSRRIWANFDVASNNSFDFSDRKKSLNDSSGSMLTTSNS